MRRICLGILLFVGACRPAPPPPDGAALFGSACARCHGRDGRGGLSSPGRAAPRDLSAGAWQDAVSDEQIRRIVLHGSGDMPSFEGVLDGPQVDAVVGHVRSLRAPAAQPQDG